AGAPAAKGEVAIARLLPRDELIGDERDDGTAFQSQNWNPPPPPPPPPAPPPPPTAPALPFTVIGKALSNGVWEAYLSRNDQIYVVRPGDVLDGTYRIDSIAPPLMTLTYLPMNQVQQLNIGATE
ncbi:MAG TPA: hypothetical protein VFF16_09440, partial [Telluria sp.]|nr:hypothetical protein [Telluria sp.]